MPDYKLVIVSTNLISNEAQKHYQDVITTNGLHNRFVNALYANEHVDPLNKVDPYYHGSYNSYGYYDAGGGRRNKKRSTKHKKRKGKKTRKYRSK